MKKQRIFQNPRRFKFFGLGKLIAQGSRIMVLAGFLMSLGLIDPGASFAQDGEKWFENVQVEGFVDVYYGYNFNDPGSGPAGRMNQFRNFDFYNDQFALSLAELAISRAPEPVGFRVDLDYGTTTDFVHCGSVNCDTAGDADTEEPFKNIQQAYVSWSPSSMWVIDAGKFVTHMGYEVIESQDNWNYSRGFLFSFAIPFYHSGIRVSHAHENFWINGYVYNGWNNVVENNAGKTFGATLGVTPIEGLTIIQNWIGGTEAVGDKRHVLDTIVTYAPTDMLSFALNYDYGWYTFPTAPDAIWTGIAAYARFTPTDASAVAARFEWYDDDKAGTTGALQIAKEVTLTGEYKVSDGLLTRLEYRRDWSTESVFASDTGSSDKSQQDTVTVGVVYSF